MLGSCNNGPVQGWPLWEEIRDCLRVGQNQFQPIPTVAQSWNHQWHWWCLCDNYFRNSKNQYAASGRDEYENVRETFLQTLRSEERTSPTYLNRDSSTAHREEYREVSLQLMEDCDRGNFHTATLARYHNRVSSHAWKKLQSIESPHSCYSIVYIVYIVSLL